MHGSSFRVVAMDRLGNSTTVEEVEELDRAGRIHRNLVDPPVKDTVTVPDGGYTIIRFWAANPGYWLFHCHLEFHAEIGMAVVFKVGSHDRFPAEPPGFPKCGDYLHDYRPWTVNYQQTSKTGRDSAGKGTGWPNTIVRWWSSSSSPCFQPPSFGWLLTVAVVIGLFACRQRQFCSL
ncbi:hypothetical protein AAG570_002322 [Ranatra chinensis]|uniref:Plastocyanin-like domain-containing protein n=1 Tax=Ranatra chinensis TaxID=642074 RepID=A0ABD0Y783_9HEMI